MTWPVAAVIIAIVTAIVTGILQTIKAMKSHPQRIECTERFSLLESRLSEKSVAGDAAILEGREHRAELELRLTVLEKMHEERHKEMMTALSEMKADLKLIQTELKTDIKVIQNVLMKLPRRTGDLLRENS